MKTPKEKAQELVMKMATAKMWEAKECALIAVEEQIQLLKSLKYLENIVPDEWLSLLNRIVYLEEVKSEIKKI